MDNSKQEISAQSGYVLIERLQDYEVVLNEQPAKLLEISAFCKEAGCRKVLILGPRTKVQLSTLDIYALGKAIADLGLKIAVVEVHDALDQDVSFLEDVVANRGYPIQFFDNEHDAKDWLGVP